MLKKILSIVLTTVLTISTIPVLKATALEPIDYYDMKTHVGNILLTASGVVLTNEDMQRAEGIAAWEACKDTIEVKIGEAWINGSKATHDQIKTWDGTFRATEGTAQDVMSYVATISQGMTNKSFNKLVNSGYVFRTMANTTGGSDNLVFDIEASNTISYELICKNIDYRETITGSIPDIYKGIRDYHMSYELDTTDPLRSLVIRIKTPSIKIGNSKMNNLQSSNQYFPFEIQFKGSTNLSVYTKEYIPVVYTPAVKANATIEKFNNKISKTSVIKIPASYKYTAGQLDWAKVEKDKVSVKSTDKPTSTEIIPIEINVEPYLEIGLSKEALNLQVQDMSTTYSDNINITISSNMDYKVEGVFEGLMDVSSVELARNLYNISFDTAHQTFDGVTPTVFVDRVERGNNKLHKLGLSITDNTKLKIGKYTGELQLRVSQL